MVGRLGHPLVDGIMKLQATRNLVWMIVGSVDFFGLKAAPLVYVYANEKDMAADTNTVVYAK